MKLLFDACMDGRCAALLRKASHDVLEVKEWQPAASDTVVLAHAFKTGRVLITLDKDLGQLIIAEGHAHCGLLRLAGFSSDEEAAACLQAIIHYGEALANGALVVFEPDKSRIRE